MEVLYLGLVKQYPSNFTFHW